MSGVRIINTWVDSLVVSYHGDKHTSVNFEHLERLKSAAQEGSHPTIEIAGCEFIVSPKGQEVWPYALVSEDFTLRIGRSAHLPRVSAKATALGLAFYGHEALLAMMDACAAQFAYTRRALSRIDIAVDFQGWVPDRDTLDNIVTRAEYRGTHGNSAEPQTYQWGKGGTVVRLYDKTAEIPVSGKEWLRRAWESFDGYDAESPVWRFEVQLRRESLAALDVETPEQAFDNPAGLIGYGLDWCDLRTPGPTRSDKRARDPRWAALASPSLPGFPIQRLKAEKYLADYKRHLPQLAGLALTTAAALNMQNFNFFWERLGKEVKSYIEDKGDPFDRAVSERRLERMK